MPTNMIPEFVESLNQQMDVARSRMKPLFEQATSALDWGQVISYIPLSGGEEIDEAPFLEGFPLRARFVNDKTKRFLPQARVQLFIQHIIVEAYVTVGMSGDSAFGGGLPPPGSIVLVGFLQEKKMAFIVKTITSRFSTRLAYGIYPEIKPGEFLYQSGVSYRTNASKVLRPSRSGLGGEEGTGKVIELPGSMAYGDWKGRLALKSREGDSGFSVENTQGAEGYQERRIKFDTGKDSSVDLILGNPVMDVPILSTSPTGNGPFKGDSVTLGTEANDLDVDTPAYDGEGTQHTVLKGLSLRPRIQPSHTGKSACNHYGVNEENFVELDISAAEAIQTGSVSPSPDATGFNANVKESMKAKPIAMRIRARNATMDIDTDGNITHESLKDIAEQAVNRYMENSGWMRVLAEKLVEIISHDGISLKGRNGIRLSDDAGNLIQIGSNGVSIMSSDKHTFSLSSSGVKIDGKLVLLEDGTGIIGALGGVIQTLINNSALMGVGVGNIAMSPALLAQLQALMNAGTGRSNRTSGVCT